MKKVISLLIALHCSLLGIAQINLGHGDSLLPRWCIDVNARGGIHTQDYTTASIVNSYPDAVSSNKGKLSFKNGSTVGGDVQIGLFFGERRHFGIGAGIGYYVQSGNVTMAGYKMQYSALDFNNNVYRQVVTVNNLKENIQTTNINIPVVFKYKNRFSKHWGFTADAGALIDVQIDNSYKTDASFNYEAIYKFTDGSHAVYDNAATPGVNDYFITKENWLKDNPGGNVQAYFDDLHNRGYNVGLNVKPATSKGKVSYSQGSVGLILKPSFNLYLSSHVALDFGVFYMYQPYTNTVAGNYRLTDKMGAYSSVLGNVSDVHAQSYGVNIGARFFLGKPAGDRDHDGVIDRRDMCPDDSGSLLFRGCPDTDGDGIIDKEDSCPRAKGPAKFFGCPDTDGDGISDKDDECPLIPGLMTLHGCPDFDGDGIADKDDSCKHLRGPLKWHGCPDTDGDDIPDNLDRCPTEQGLLKWHGCPDSLGDASGSWLNPDSKTPDITVNSADMNVTVNAKNNVPVNLDNIDPTTPILFDVNRTTIKEESMPVLRKAVQELNAGSDITIHIDGFTDNTGDPGYNKDLSLMRAMVVKLELVKMGAEFKKIKIQGYGAERPTAPNTTREGRRKNRRAVMKLK